MEIENLTSRSVNFNMLWAQKAYEYVHEVLPNGSTNQNPRKCEEVVLRKLYDARENSQYANPGGWTSDVEDEGNLQRIIRCAAVAERLKFGNCDEMASVAFTFLFRNGVNCQYVHWPLNDGDHSFVVVNNGQDRACICDPWGHLCSPGHDITEFMNHMGNIYDVVPPASRLKRRAMNTEADSQKCLNYIDGIYRTQAAILDAGNITNVPDFSQMNQAQQMQALQNLNFLN